jgi:fused signal recognition particle receptor
MTNTDTTKTLRGLKKSRQTWFSRLAGLFNERSAHDQEFWDQAEELLIGADVGVKTTEALLEALSSNTSQDLLSGLKQEMVSLFKDHPGSSWPGALGNGPFVILIVGINGVGKTTSIVKLAKRFTQEGKRVLLAGADTFRAAAIEQLKSLASQIGVDVIAHQQGGDPGAVVFDAFQAAQARKADILMVDTAGRLHTKWNLMEELAKIRRVLSKLDPDAPHQTLLVIDATLGQNGLIQAQSFADTLGSPDVFLTKMDGTAKGGIVFPIAQQLSLPILYVGTGESIDDLVRFDPREFVEALFSPSET